MNRNENIRKDKGKCRIATKKCSYLCSGMCNLFRVQLDPVKRGPLKMCDYIYTVTYNGKP